MTKLLKLVDQTYNHVTKPCRDINNIFSFERKANGHIIFQLNCLKQSTTEETVASLRKLMKGKALRKHSLHEKTAASFLLKLFISSLKKARASV